MCVYVFSVASQVKLRAVTLLRAVGACLCLCSVRPVVVVVVICVACVVQYESAVPCGIYPAFLKSLPIPLSFGVCTTYPCVYQVTWTKLTRGNPDHAWVAKVPTWPLTLVFLAQFLAIAGAVCE